MRAPYAVRQRWKRAKALRAAAHRIDRTFYSFDDIGPDLVFPASDVNYKAVNELVSALEKKAAELEGPCR